MNIPSNILQQVATYAESGIVALQNQNCFMGTLNNKFKTFNTTNEANLGDTINLQLPTQAIANNGLVASFQGVKQNLVPLICDQAKNSAMAFSAQQFIFNARQYMEEFGMARIQELGAVIEENVALNAQSAVPVYSINDNGQSIPTGALHTESGPYRFYGDGTTPINSFQQLAEISALERNFGSAPGPLNFYLDNVQVVSIVGSGLAQFTPARNDVIANSWDLGTYKGSNNRYYQSNLLSIHYSGNVGESDKTLTVVSTNDPTGQNITQLTCSVSGGGSDADAIKSGDLFQFEVSTLRYLTFRGHVPSQCKVQIRATADAEQSGGNVTFDIYPPLVSAPGASRNISAAIVAGMTLSSVPSHRCGLVTGGNAFFLAMPALPSTEPFPSSTQTDKETGVSMRMYYGNRFGENVMGLVNDAVFASLCVPNYSRRLVLPLT